MNRRFSARRQLKFWVVSLLAVAAAGLTYKIGFLGLSLRPGTASQTWQVEAEVSFDATDGPVEVSLAIPRQSSADYRMMDERVASGGYGVRIDEGEADRRVVWARRNADGRQTLFYRVRLFDIPGTVEVRPAAAPEVPDVIPFTGSDEVAAESLMNSAFERSAGPVSCASELVGLLSQLPRSPDAELLLDDNAGRLEITMIATRLLALKGIASRVARGVFLEDEQRRQPLEEVLEVYDGVGWQVVDPITGVIGSPQNFVLWQRGGRSLLDVIGGASSNIRLSVLGVLSPTSELARQRDSSFGGLPFAFSMADLPIEDQNVFKVLSLIPLGALVICLFRNIIGVATTGTFMPMLIALAFRETSLVGGVVLFVTLVACGLVIRGYLSGLNLLLVPRISSVVVIVIGLMVVLAWLSHRLGFESGLTVTFFPFVVIAWTIERASAVWEEVGGSAAITQCAGSLCVAAAVHLLWQAPAVEYLLAGFPEFNLIILALILLVGSYTGYRLTELRRFEPLVTGSQSGGLQ